MVIGCIILFIFLSVAIRTSVNLMERRCLRLDFEDSFGKVNPRVAVNATCIVRLLKVC